MKDRSKKKSLVINPFQSEAQRKWMHANHPEMADRWEEHTPKGKKLPRYKKGAKRGSVVRNRKRVSGTKGPNTLDPSRTITLRKALAAELDRRFLKLRSKVYQWVAGQQLISNTEGWITLDSGQHVYIDRDGNMQPGGPKEESVTKTSDKERPPEKPTKEEWVKWNDLGWSYGEHGWEPPYVPPVASEHVSTEVHAKAPEHLSEEGKQTIAAAHDWETTKPWNLTKEQVASGEVPGVVLTRKEHGEAAHFEGGKVHLSPKFFDDPAYQHEEVKRHILYHELGHQLADTMTADGTSFQLHDAGVIPAKHDMGSGTGGGHGDEEALADVYATLHTDLPWLRKNYPKLEKPVVDRARALGMPLPPGLATTAAAVPVVRQSTDYSCGAACYAAVARYWGIDPTTERGAIEELETSSKHGTTPRALELAAGRANLHAEVRTGMTLEELKGITNLGVPVICAIQRHGTPEQDANLESGHWVVRRQIGGHGFADTQKFLMQSGVGTKK